MSDPIKDLERLTEARKKATAGPWQTHAIWSDDNETVISRGVGQVDGMGLNHGDDGYELFDVDDAAFIALAGSIDLPALLAHVKAMEKVVKLVVKLRKQEKWLHQVEHCEPDRDEKAVGDARWEIDETNRQIETALFLYTKGQADAER